MAAELMCGRTQGQSVALIQVLKRSMTMWAESEPNQRITDSFTVKREDSWSIWRSMTSVILAPAQVRGFLCLNRRASQIPPRLLARLLRFFLIPSLANRLRHTTG